MVEKQARIIPLDDLVKMSGFTPVYYENNLPGDFGWITVKDIEFDECSDEYYRKTWRIWDDEPTSEQRKRMEWNK